MSQIRTAPMSAPAAGMSVQNPCPRCKEPLIDPNGLGWCKACGYCRSLAESEAKASAELAPAQSNQLVATGAAVGTIPRWFWAAVLGIALIAGATYAGGHYLKLSPLERAMLTTIQICGGLAVMFIGQFVALMRIAPEDSGLGFWDAMVPFRLYQLVFKRLPKARLTIYTGVWGATAILSAVIFIGGLEHWLNYLPGKNKNLQNQTKKATSAR